MLLSERKDKILRLAIEDYICNALPITSSVVQQKHLSDISSATLRSELSALEAMGFLKQLHVSSGRVPTTEGYKYYVERLIEGKNFEKAKLEGVKTAIKSRTSSISEIISEIANMVSKQTNLPTVVFVSGYQKLIVEQVTIVPLIDSDLMLLIKTKEGVVHCNIKCKSSAKACEDASYYLTKKFAGKTIKQLMETMQGSLAEISEELEGFKSIVQGMVDVLSELLEKGTMNIKRTGSAKLLENYKEEIDETHNLFSLLENEDELKQTLTLGEDQRDISCEIADMGEKKGCAIIKAPLIIDGEQVASVGVLGPRRIDYASIASVLKFVMDEMDEVNTNRIGEGEGDKNGKS